MLAICSFGANKFRISPPWDHNRVKFVKPRVSGSSLRMEHRLTGRGQPTVLVAIVVAAIAAIFAAPIVSPADAGGEVSDAIDPKDFGARRRRGRRHGRASIHG